MLIRPETVADIAAVRCVVARALGSDVEADLVDRIRASPGYVPEMALVATVAGVVAEDRAADHHVADHRAGSASSPRPAMES